MNAIKIEWRLFKNADLLCSLRCVSACSCRMFTPWSCMFALHLSSVYGGRPAIHSPASVPIQSHPLVQAFLHSSLLQLADWVWTDTEMSIFSLLVWSTYLCFLCVPCQIPDFRYLTVCVRQTKLQSIAIYQNQGQKSIFVILFLFPFEILVIFSTRSHHFFQMEQYEKENLVVLKLKGERWSTNMKILTFDTF